MTANYFVTPWLDTARFDKKTPPGSYRIGDRYSHFRIWVKQTAHGWSQRHEWKPVNGGNPQQEAWIPTSISGIPKGAYRCNSKGEPYRSRRKQ